MALMNRQGQDREADSATEKNVAESVFPDDESKKATERAMALLLHKDRTEHELTVKLRKAEYSDEAVSFAVEYVRKYGYIDDLRYAKSYIELHIGNMSRRQIRQKLFERGVSDEIVSEAFSAYEETDETGVDPEETAMNLLIRKRLRGRSISDLTYEEKQKQMRYLAGKGFPTEMIRRAFLDGRDE
ncbi:MAG: regulatory protein RecX [Eubacterium sp.]|nr:regulatory protein RecX [Eubacterium sp.]